MIERTEKRRRELGRRYTEACISGRRQGDSSVLEIGSGLHECKVRSAVSIVGVGGKATTWNSVDV